MINVTVMNLEDSQTSTSEAAFGVRSTLKCHGNLQPALNTIAWSLSTKAVPWTHFSYWLSVNSKTQHFLPCGQKYPQSFLLMLLPLIKMQENWELCCQYTLRITREKRSCCLGVIDSPGHTVHPLPITQKWWYIQTLSGRCARNGPFVAVCLVSNPIFFVYFIAIASNMQWRKL